MKIPLVQHFKDIEELSKKIKMLDNSKEQAALLKDLKIIKKESLFIFYGFIALFAAYIISAIYILYKLIKIMTNIYYRRNFLLISLRYEIDKSVIYRQYFKYLFLYTDVAIIRYAYSL